MRSIHLLAVYGTLLFGFVSPSWARTIVVDGNPGDWKDADARMDVLAFEDLGFIGRNATGDGEYIWRDRAGDQRTDLGAGTDFDLTEFRVSGDATYFYFMTSFSTMNTVGGQNTPLVIVTLDTDQVTGSGQTAMPAYCNTQVAGDAAWEVALETRFGYHGEETLLRVSDAKWSTIHDAGLCALDARYKTIECRIAWSELRDGVDAPLVLPARLRLTASVYASDTASETTVHIGSGSYALDVLTNYGDPGSVENSWKELLDQTINYSADLFVNASGNIYAPLVVSELYYDAVEPTTELSEFVELTNVSGRTLNAQEFKLTDADALSTYTASEGAVVFPGGATFAAKQVMVWAYSCGDYRNYFGTAPSFAYQVGNSGDCPTPPPLTPTYTPWLTVSGSGSYGRINLGNNGDALILLDRADTVIDVVPYKAAPESWNQVNFAALGAAQGKSLRRKDAASDTNDIATDFVAEATPNPGVVELAEICNGEDDDHDGVTDNLQGSCVTGLSGVCAVGARRCELDAELCVPLIEPGMRSETCNGQDDDCDGQTDNIPGSCTTGLNGVCAAGRPACTAEMNVTCAIEIAPGERAETCDGQDDDCDGVTDNVPGAGDGCSVGVGECARTGKKACVGTQLVCGAVPGEAKDELCNGRDDNCDGTTDNGQDALCGSAECRTMRCRGENGCLGTAINDWSPCAAGACFAGQCQALAPNDTCETAVVVSTVGDFDVTPNAMAPHLYRAEGLGCFAVPWSVGLDLFYSLSALNAQTNYDLEVTATGTERVGLVFWSGCGATAACRAGREVGPGQALTLTFSPDAERTILQVLLPSAAAGFRLRVSESAVAPDGDTTEAEAFETFEGEDDASDAELSDLAESEASDAENFDLSDGETIEESESEAAEVAELETSDGDTSEAERETTQDGDVADEEQDPEQNDTAIEAEHETAQDGDTTEAERETSTDGDTADEDDHVAQDGDGSEAERETSTDGDHENDGTPIEEKRSSSGGCAQGARLDSLLLVGLLGLITQLRRRRAV